MTQRVKTPEAIKVSAVTDTNNWVLRCLLHQTLIWFLRGEVNSVSSHWRSCISRKCSAPGKARNIKRKKRSRDGDRSEGKVDKEWWKIKDWIGVGTENQGEIKGRQKKMKGYWKKENLGQERGAGRLTWKSLKEVLWNRTLHKKEMGKGAEHNGPEKTTATTNKKKKKDFQNSKPIHTNKR